MSQPQPARLVFDEVVIDVAGQRLWRDGAEQPLEPKAFAVLALLAGAPGRVFGRDEILDTVWGHRHVTPGVLNRVMTLLRHALGEDALNPRFLHTVHGIGYRFDPPPGATAADVEPTPTPAAETIAAAEVPRRGLLRPLPLLVALVLVALVFAGWKFRSRTEPPPTVAAPVSAPERSIAVLPLVNASNDEGQLFFSDGLSESLIDALSRFDGLKVIGRTSAFQFRDGKDDSATIGRKLGVSYLLGGSVQRAGDTVRISTSLTRAADGQTLWAEHYDRPYRDLFALQDEITQAVAGALHARLVSADLAAKQSDRPPSGSIAAYNAYLKSQQAFANGEQRQAIAHAAEAMRLDPSYAMAWAQMSISSSLSGRGEADPTKARVAFRNGRLFADTALRLAPELGRAHAARGMALLGPEPDRQGALREFRRAVRLAPDDNRIHGGLSQALTVNGKIREAAGERHVFLSREPLVVFNYFAYAQFLMSLGRLDEAENYLRIGQALSGSTESGPNWRLQLAALRGDAGAAMEAARQAPPKTRDWSTTLAAQIGPDHGAADAALSKFLADHPSWGDTEPYDLVLLYALRGDAAKTVEWLERVWARNHTDTLFLLRDPFVLRFRDDPRLIAFCAKVGLAPPSQSEALSIDQIRAASAGKR